MGGPDTNDDIDDALRGGWGGNHQNDEIDDALRGGGTIKMMM